METTITKDQAIEIAKTSPEAENKIKTIFPQFYSKDWRNITSVKDACDAKGIDMKAFYKKLEGLNEDTIAYEELKLLTEVINNDPAFPNWNDTNQKKWFPWFDISSGFGFSAAGYGDWTANASVGSRLLLKDEAMVLHMVKHFLPIYEKYIVKK